MTQTAEKSFEEMKPGVKAPAKETLLTPRFYTTDFDKMAKMNLSPNEEELRAILEEFRADYNRHHFVRDEEFDQAWEEKVDPETKRLFVEFLERSCTAEFSGFLLYKELGRRLREKNPILAECFTLMSRDEARHAGFLNKSMSDFNLALDLGFLTKQRKYTFFQPKFIFYATYLSEKIGYWRYITIYRHLEKHPENRFYPLFRLFGGWCQDENRHGDFFDALMRSQPQVLRGPQARLWCRFFLVAVFGTMYLNDQQRAGFYEALGLDAKEYNKYVIRRTNDTAGRVFPEILNVDHPAFYGSLDVCVENNAKLAEIEKSNAPKFSKFLRKLPLYASNGWQFLRLYFMQPINADARLGTVR
ncbi:magnesium-protoporphyrin IX monomethyl ester (oxidative) cyclase [Geitlerinema sp. PCC 9228]|jgi:magnesium-protoporphyrin IX monomethyl ester (oxidative) cyclase|uniref:magnesium-protoporphyrin IX monomethyl ester (oxidative) cyclase n=1 Tax=Geitlerinema sp. PCC 9228 TaxID=111611 RepID=UPI0008F9C940|nr:magnesium-protoporphyrin IX monomethyl ester (oxidative) cyclase [Geitlerinema sp. PCC 9228]